MTTRKKPATSRLSEPTQGGGKFAPTHDGHFFGIKNSMQTIDREFGDTAGLGLFSRVTKEGSGTPGVLRARG